MILDITGKRIKSSSKKSIRELLVDYMETNSLSNKQVYTILAMDKNSFTDFLAGKTTSLKVHHLLKMMSLLGIQDHELVDLCLNGMEEDEIDRINATKRTSFIINNFDIQGLKKEGFLKGISDYSEIEKKIVSFFGLNTIFEYNKATSNFSLFSKSKISVEEQKKQKMINFWLKCSQATFEYIDNPYDYNEDLLIQLTKKIKTFTTDIRNGFFTIIDVLFKIGVTVIVEPYLTRTTSYGVTMMVNSKPCIIITDQGKRYDKLWFTLLHEIYHILNDFEFIHKTKYHISGDQEGDIFVSEEDADKFASQALVGKQSLAIASKVINYPFKINQMAERLQIHPCIIYGQYLDNLPKAMQSKEFPKYQKFLPKTNEALKYHVTYNPIKSESIESAAQVIKGQFIKAS
ncbi:hypothetical protein EYV94_27295 [Puteibacter caeruleilacunae]|nr:hypothetical protein EYV94_27295 [Puteibacter caeruleilacunae]